MKLKEALDAAHNFADGGPRSNWAQAFVHLLEANGYCITPLEATEKMARQLPWAAEDEAKRDYAAMLAARPNLED